MKKGFLSFLCVLFTVLLFGQNRIKGPELAGFDKAAAWKLAQQRSSLPSIQQEYFEFLQRKYVAQQRAKNTVVNANSSYQFSYDQASKTANINLTPQSAYCQNFGFEGLNISNWTGDVWTLSGLDWTTPPTWGAGFNTQGTNTPAQALASGWSAPTTNRYTIMTIPPTVNNPLGTSVGWDSIAVNPVTHLSDVPFVPPFGGGVTCRLGNANTGEETERIRYTLAVTAQNSQITVSYAVVLQNPPGHSQTQQPFFQINTYDQNGNPINGCGNYQIDAFLASSDTSFHAASVWDTWSSSWYDPSNASWSSYAIYYKKWTMVGVDLQPYIGQNVTIEFRTADCAQGGHFGYAYIDATCSPSQVQVNMCPGSVNQEAIGPAGYLSYQWYGPNSTTNAIAAPNGTNDTLSITNGNTGDIYYLDAISANGCTTHLQAILQVSHVNIQYSTSTPSCPGGNSGTAGVVPTGSPGPYTYTWTSSGGAQVGTTNPCTGLAPGTYSVHIDGGGCGSFDTTVAVGIAPPITQSSTKNFCGSAAYLTTPAGATNIQWYNSTGTPVTGSAGSNDTLLVTNAAGGQVYSVVYLLSGCYDSLRITLAQVTGGTLSHTGIQNTCIGSSNGQATVTLATSQPAPYNYSMTGPGFNQTFNGVSQTAFPLTGLAYGTYTVTAFDGMCFYGDVFKIDTIPIPVTLTVTPKSLCKNDSAYINYSFGGAPPTSCQLSTAGCSSSQSFFVGPANNAGTAYAYPTPFGNYYTKMKAQYIYTAAELIGGGLSAGKISSITFNCTQINGATAYPDFNISIGCTGQTTYSAFPTTSDLIPGLSNVYSSASYNVVLGANLFTFSQPYEWDGISNIVVEVCFEFPGTYNYIMNCVVDCSTSTQYPSMTIRSDTDPTCTLSSTAFYYTTAEQMRPTATFGWCSSVATPNMYTYSLNPSTGLIGSINPPATTIIQPASTTTYTFTTTSNVGGCAKKDTFTIAVVKPFNINMPAATSFCSNMSSGPINATFTDLTTGAPLQVPAVWTGAGISNNNGLGTATFNPATSGIGTYTLMLTAGGQCMLQDSVVYTVNQWQSGQINTIGPFCVYDPGVQVQAASAGGTWYGPVSGAGLFNPATAGVSSNLTPPYHIIKYVVNGGTPCPDSSSIQVQVFAKPLVSFATDTNEGCEPNVSILFTPNVTPPGGTYNWNFGNGQNSTSPNPGNPYVMVGTYSPKLTYVDPNGCTDNFIKSGWIIVHPKPHASFYANPGSSTILEPKINFINTSTGPNNSWHWTFAGLDTSSLRNPSHEFPDPGQYEVSLLVVNSFGCRDSVIEFIKIDPDNMLYVPGGFSPNSDGINDVFQAQGFGIFDKDSFKMIIHDRWGSKLFESHDLNSGWDGTKGGEVVQQDVYVWEITYKDISGKVHVKTGNVNLIK